jgi:hypothetical protein
MRPEESFSGSFLIFSVTVVMIRRHLPHRETVFQSSGRSNGPDGRLLTFRRPEYGLQIDQHIFDLAVFAREMARSSAGENPPSVEQYMDAGKLIQRVAHVVHMHFQVALHDAGLNRHYSSFHRH